MWIKNDKGQLKHSNLLQITPDVVPLGSERITSLSSTVEKTVAAGDIPAGTTMLRLYAKTQDVYLLWGTDDCPSDGSGGVETLPAGQVVDLKIPNGIAAFNVIEAAASASLNITYK